ncbi:sacsin-like [Mercenaria mercenaria]|uniref:sacsin-like n=1 Tax=Mercenaria mercenaria TaxID=6596 RepID=UPI00234EBB3A|nr:sacsin-like [Mercenaria mercenaria]
MKNEFVCKQLAGMLDKKVKLIAFEKYHELFPHWEKATDLYWKSLVSNFYRIVTEEEIEIFPVIRATTSHIDTDRSTEDVQELQLHWVSLSRSENEFSGTFNVISKYVASQYAEGKPFSKSDAQSVEITLKKMGMKVIETPLWVSHALSKSGIKYIPACSPEYVISFLKTFEDENESTCHLGKTNALLSETTISSLMALQSMLRYVIKSHSFKEKVEGLPLCLTNSGLLQIYTRNMPKFCSDMCDVLSGSADQFVNSQILLLVDRKEYYEAGVIKNFEVTDFVSNIAETFDPSVFETGHHLLWNKELGVPLKPGILERIFLFMYRRSLEMVEYCNEAIVNHKLFQANVEKLSNWSLVPSCYGFGSEKKFELVPVCKTNHLFYRGFGNDDLLKVVEKFNIPQLDVLAFSDIGKQIIYPLQKMLPSTDRPVKLLECLLYYKARIQASALNCDEGISVLSFFDDRINHMKKHMNENTLRNMFRNLPLYVSHQREVVSIEGYSDVAVMPYGIPYDGIDVWAQSTRIVLLKDTEKLINLYQFLHLPRKTELEVYTEKIIPNFNHFPRNTWKTHIEYIKNTILKTSFNQAFDTKQCHLVNQLKALSFVRVSGVDKKVNELYDQNNPVFSCMLHDDCFLPHEYQDDSWLDFMEKLGLVMEPSDEMLIDFAHSLEAKINSPINDVTKEQSSALVDCLFSRNWTDTLERIKEIRFIVPFKVDLQRSMIAKQPGNGELLICFSDTVSCEHADYCWSSLSLLSSVPPSMKMLKGLGIHEYPPINRVVQHCQNVTEVFKVELEKEKPRVCSNFVKYQMEKLYAVLHKQYDPKVQQKIQVTPIVFHPEDERMLPVKQIVINLTADEEVRPYLYKLPNCFGPYEDFFHMLGSHKIPMCSDYCLVLEKIKDQFKDGPVPPNKLMCMKKSLENIVKLLDKEREPFGNVKHIFIPDRNNVLISSKDLTVSNNDTIEERLEGKVPIHFFVGFREMEILCVHDPVEPVLRWPENLRPDILTEVVTEQISADNVVHEECMEAQRIESLLRTPQFVEAVLRLVKHQMKINKATFQQNFAHTLMSRLTNIRITKVTGLKTFLTYKGNKVDGTDANASCFIKSEIKKNAEGDEIKEHELYFQINADDELLSTLLDEKHGLLKLIDLCTDGILGKEMYQCLSSSLQLLEQPSNIKRKLDKIPIDAYDLPSTWNVSVFPRPGTYVEEKFHSFLEQSISPFKLHDYMYVALEVEDADDSIDPLYIYAHIVSENRRTQGDSVLRVTYNVNVGRSEGLIIVPLYRLYRFKSKQPEEVNALVVYDIEPIGSVPIDENFRRVRQMLTDAWTMDEKERKRVIRRLLTQWHPDRNRDHREYAQRLFNYIHEVVIKLKHNELIDEVITNDTGRMPPDMSRSPFGSADTAAVYDRGCRLAAGFRDNIQDYNRSTRTGNFVHYKAEEAVVRHVGEAKRWHRQAVQDFKAAESNVFTGAQDQSFNWVCYKCHQASEKALKAAWFAKNANRATRRKHSLTAIAIGLDDGSLHNEVSSLEGITGDYSSMRYPDAVVGRIQIPSEIFDSTKAEKAIEITKRILDLAADFID